MSAKIINPGIQAIIVDRGRLGQHGIGLTTGGAFDTTAYETANHLVGNKNGEAVIEVTIGLTELQFETACTIAITGAELDITLNGVAQPRYQSIRVQPEDSLKLGSATRGCRAYIAISGGIDVTPQFGSRTCVTREQIGGIDGTKLNAGDILPLNRSHPFATLTAPSQLEPTFSRDVELRVVLGYQHNKFSTLAKNLFFSSEYLISQRFDRMGCRVEGPSVAANINAMLSEGICLGAIQVPADGQPIILLNDRQTIGGYPKLGSVLSIDLPRLAQMMPGDRIRFTEISVNEAHNLIHLHSHRQQQLLEAIYE